MPKSKSQLRSEANDRRESYSTRSPQEQMNILNLRFGVNMGAMRERKRLNYLIAKAA